MLIDLLNNPTFCFFFNELNYIFFTLYLTGYAKQRLYVCPMCKLVFENWHILQEHVELHLTESRAEGNALRKVVTMGFL